MQPTKLKPLKTEMSQVLLVKSEHKILKIKIQEILETGRLAAINQGLAHLANAVTNLPAANPTP
jgi:hypothetical protein